jgi:hypothetical protein
MGDTNKALEGVTAGDLSYCHHGRLIVGGGTRPVDCEICHAQMRVAGLLPCTEEERAEAEQIIAEIVARVERPQDQVEATFRDTLRDALVDSAGLDAIPEPEPLVDGILYRDSLAWIQGKRSNGKSFVALDIAGCVGTGHHWQGRAVHRGNVLFIAAEGVSGVRWRVRAWEESYGREMANVQFLPIPVQANLDQWGHLVELAHYEFAFGLIVLDTQARMTVGMEENAAKDMGEWVDRLEWLRRSTGACILTVHHQGRTGEHMRGSTALEGAATSIIQVVKDDAEITVSCEKQKDAEEFADIALKLVPIGDSAVLMPSDGGMGGLEATAAFRTAVKWWATFRDDPVSVSRLTKAEIAPERTLYRHVRELVDRGLVEPVPRGAHKLYRLRYDPNMGPSLPLPLPPATP